MALNEVRMALSFLLPPFLRAERFPPLDPRYAYIQVYFPFCRRDMVAGLFL